MSPLGGASWFQVLAWVRASVVVAAATGCHILHHFQPIMAILSILMESDKLWVWAPLLTPASFTLRGLPIDRSHASDISSVALCFQMVKPLQFASWLLVHSVNRPLIKLGSSNIRARLLTSSLTPRAV